MLAENESKEHSTLELAQTPLTSGIHRRNPFLLSLN